MDERRAGTGTEPEPWCNLHTRWWCVHGMHVLWIFVLTGTCTAPVWLSRVKQERLLAFNSFSMREVSASLQYHAGCKGTSNYSFLDPFLSNADDASCFPTLSACFPASAHPCECVVSILL